MIIGHGPEQLIAAESEQAIEVIRVGRRREGCRTACSTSEILKPLEQRRELCTLLPDLVGHVCGREQTLYGKPLTDGGRLILLEERDLPDLGLRKLLRTSKLIALLRGPNVARRE